MKLQNFVNRVGRISLVLLVGLSAVLAGALWAGAVSVPAHADEPPTQPISQLASLNPNPPAAPVRLIFIHHSTGGNWLADPADNDLGGDLGHALMNNNYFVSATNYGWGPDSIGDRTDIINWPEWFTGPNRDTYTTALYNESDQNFGGFGQWPRLATNPGGENQVIMFKSCFPNSAIEGSPTDPPTSYDDGSLTVGNAKRIYLDLLAYFSTRQDKLFVVITAPPLASGDTNSIQATNARAFNEWLVNDWLTGYPYTNVAVFDFYNVLTSNGGSTRTNDPNTNDLGWSDGNHHRWWNGDIQHIQTVSNNYAAYPSGDSHPSQAGNLKATGEFVPLLNIFYHRWQDSTLTTRKIAQAAAAQQGDTITYTIVIQNYPVPITATLYLTDTVPAGLAYVPGSLSATTGPSTDAAAPTLTWSGQLTPTPVITITYAVTVTTAFTQTIVNTAVIAAPGYTTTYHTAMVYTKWGGLAYLPTILKDAGPPTAPVLNPINNSDGDGSYTVSWSNVSGATGYVLQEDDNPSFNSPTTVYSGSSTSTTISGRGIGTYYYRVQATNSLGNSPWSNVVSVQVTQLGVVPEPGTWYCYSDSLTIRFTVSSDSSSASNGYMTAACGSKSIAGPVLIQNSSFKLSHSDGINYISATFDDVDHAQGSFVFWVNNSCWVIGTTTCSR